MAKMMTGTCDACGESAPLGPLASTPREWYDVRPPGHWRQAPPEHLMACSAYCLGVVAMSQLDEEVEPFSMDLVPMVAPRSNIVHAVPLGRSADEPPRFAMCSLARVEALVPAVGDNLRACKRCSTWADREQPGWFAPVVAVES